MHKLKIEDFVSCDRGENMQTITHIGTQCSKYRFRGGLQDIHNVTEQALKWLLDLQLHLRSAALQMPYAQERGQQFSLDSEQLR